jgi:hypothetical protein
MTARIAPDALVAFGADVLVAVGVPEPDARLVADSLVTADLWGPASHGLLRLGWYVARLRSGAMRTVPAEIVVDGGAVAVLDGRDGVGQGSSPTRPATRPCGGPATTASESSPCATATTSGRPRTGPAGSPRRAASASSPPTAAR